MKRLFLSFLILMIALCGCYNNLGEYKGRPSEPSFETPSFDFCAEGILIQTEQYGKCYAEIYSSKHREHLMISGKNLCGGAPGTALPKEYNGIRYASCENGGISATGTATKSSLCYVSGRWGSGTTDDKRIFLPEGTYTLSGCPEGGSETTYRLTLAVVGKDDKISYYYDFGEGVTFILRESSYVGTCIQIAENAQVKDLCFYPQIEIGDKPTDYEKYRGNKYDVVVINGRGTFEIELSEDEVVEEYTFLSTGDSLKIMGFGAEKNSVQPIWHASRPHFAIIDDDGKDDVYTVLLPLLNNRGIKFSTSVIPTKLDTVGYLTTDQLREIASAGNKVMCHGKNHVNLKNTATTFEHRYDEIVGGKQMLESLGFKVDTMVYPNGSYDDEVLEITKSAYTYGIATSGDTAYGHQRYNRDPINVYAIQRINIGSYYQGESSEEKAEALENAKKNIDVCIENNYLCVIMTHVGDAGSEGIDQIIELVDYIESKGYQIDDFDTAIKAHIPPIE